MENYWSDEAAKLKAGIANKGEEFWRTASLEEIERCAGADFGNKERKEKTAIISVMRMEYPTA